MSISTTSEADYVSNAISSRVLETTKLALDLTYKIAIFDGAAIALSVTLSTALLAAHHDKPGYTLVSVSILRFSWIFFIASIAVTIVAAFLLFRCLALSYEAAFNLGIALRNVEETEHKLSQKQHNRKTQAMSDIYDGDSLENMSRILSLVACY